MGYRAAAFSRQACFQGKAIYLLHQGVADFHEKSTVILL